MVSAIISRIIVLVFGTLYPAYASYKAVKNKNVKEYVKWMMYWIVFALFTCAETFSDTFLSWVPFYYEIKIIFVLWMLSPATKGSSILYRKFVHPQLMKREEKIDAYIAQASDKGYTALLHMGSKGFNYATNVVLKTAVKGQAVVVDQLKKSYSMNDLSVTGERMSLRTRDDLDFGTDDIDRVLEDRDRTNEMLRKNPTYQYQRQSYHEEGRVAPGSSDMYDLDERDEEVEIIEEEFQPQPEGQPQSRRTTRSYKHEEAAHFATMPRMKTKGSKK